jgi:hypothetical protein
MSYIQIPGSSGNVLFNGGNNGINANNNLFWDNTNGRLGVNTTSPTKSVDIAGNLRISASGDLFNDSPGNFNIITENNATIHLCVQGSANPKLSVSNGTSGIRFNNYGYASSSTDVSVNITASSDENLKNVVSNFTRGLEALIDIIPITYKWTEDSGLDMENEYTGFGAQNVQKSIPEAVFSKNDENGNPTLTLSDRPIIATLINAVNQLSSKVNDLQREIDNLKSK